MAQDSIHHDGINPDFVPKSKKTKELDYYLQGLHSGNRFILSECITLLESTDFKKRNLAIDILRKIPTNHSNSFRIGITGAPGVGKSTFIEALGVFVLSKKRKPAILAIDPSSQINKGSILGDKTRMQSLSSNVDAFIRPSPAGAILGGTAEFTKEAILLCEAAGFDFIIVETVGVGQSEIEVGHITDINILLLQPGAGDDIQGIKRGIMENADIFVVTKADGAQADLALQTKKYYTSAINLMHHELPSWKSPVIVTSAISNTNIDQVYQAIEEYFQLMQSQHLLSTLRQKQEIRWFEKQTIEIMKKQLFENEVIKQRFEYLTKSIQEQSISPPVALFQMAEEISKMINAKKE